MKPHEHIILEIARERERQMAEEGWTPEHDDTHTDGEMARAAAQYAKIGATNWEARHAQTLKAEGVLPPVNWPWAAEWWKPKDPRRNLIRAAALLIAEIERLDRAAAKRAADV